MNEVALMFVFAGFVTFMLAGLVWNNINEWRRQHWDKWTHEERQQYVDAMRRMNDHD